MKFIKTKINKKIIIQILIFVFICNLIIHISAFYDNLNSAEWKSEVKQVNLYMAAASSINEMDICPLMAIFGLNSPILKPFMYVRDSLYSMGVSYLPKDDTEIYMWWIKVKFIDYYRSNNSIMPFFIDRNSNKAYVKKHLNEVYDNLLNLAKFPFTNSEKDKIRYELFIIASDIYTENLINIFKTKNEDLTPLYKNGAQVDKVLDLTILNGKITIYFLKNKTMKTILTNQFMDSDIGYFYNHFNNASTQILLGRGLLLYKTNCYNALLNLNLSSTKNLIWYSTHYKFEVNRYVHRVLIDIRLYQNKLFLRKVPLACIKKVNVPNLIIKGL